MNKLTHNLVKISLGTDRILTDRSGINQLLYFHYNCLTHYDTCIEICLKDLQWMDGNLCALLGGIISSLKKTNNLHFILNQEDIETKFDILIHNDFLPIKILSRYKKSTCIPFKPFNVKEKDAFIDYVEYEVLRHNAMPKFSEGTIDKLIHDLSELYGNIDKHAFTDMPFFMCGQYFPRAEIVKFTICDLGIGFLENINKLIPEIKTYGQAIKWATNGNTSKMDAPGGTGLKNLKDYCNQIGGKFSIISGDYMWCSDTERRKPILYPEGIMPINRFHQGSIINLEFSKKRLDL